VFLLTSSNCFMSTALYLVVLFASICGLFGADGDVCNISQKRGPYTFSVCTMVRNEARYIEEWVAYHMLMKVDHFYIYNDRGTDNIEEVLAPYIKKGTFGLFFASLYLTSR
jgi:Glycosyltransferase family 92